VRVSGPLPGHPSEEGEFVMTVRTMATGRAGGSAPIDPAVTRCLVLFTTLVPVRIERFCLGEWRHIERFTNPDG
jgi:hypothetical protein